jgi:integrase
MAKYARVKCRPATIKEYDRALCGPDTKLLHKRPISKVTKRDILGIMDEIQARGAMSAADRTLSYLRKFFNWCADRDYIDQPPTDRIKPLIGLVKRERALTQDEIVWMWRAFEVEESRGSVFAPALKLMLLTGQRVDEVAELTWNELSDLTGDDPTWSMPKAPPPPADQRTKNGLPHLVPLSPQAVTIIRSLKRNSDYLFSTTGETPISGWSRLKNRLDCWLTTERKRDGLRPLAAWQFRDLRRTVSTGMNEWLGIDPHIADACLNHISGQAKQGVAGTYNKALYLGARREALRKWGAFIEGLVDERR